MTKRRAKIVRVRKDGDMYNRVELPEDDGEVIITPCVSNDPFINFARDRAFDLESLVGAELLVEIENPE